MHAVLTTTLYGLHVGLLRRIVSNPFSGIFGCELFNMLTVITTTLYGQQARTCLIVSGPFLGGGSFARGLFGGIRMPT